MTSRATLSLTVTILLLVAGNIAFKYASGTIRLSQPTTLLSPTFIGAIAIYGIATLMWMYVLSQMPLTRAFPFYGLTFVLVPLAARVFLGEPLRVQTLVGGAVILLGVFIASTAWGK